MTTNVRSNRGSQIVTWTAIGLFLLGFFLHAVSVWTSPILGVWFVGTQKPRRGFLWMVAFGFVPSLLFGWRKIPMTGPVPALQYVGWTLLVAMVGVLPFTYHRLVSPRLPGFLGTLPFPLASAAVPTLALALNLDAISRPGLTGSLILWFASTLVWLWNRESRATPLVFGAGIVLAAGLQFAHGFKGGALLGLMAVNTVLGQVGVGASLLFGIWALFNPHRNKTWADRPGTVALLRSPFSGEPLHVAIEKGHESLISTSGERFPVRNGIAAFLKPEDLIGDNGKYNHLYETIAGFYDDTQRLFGGLRGVDLNSYFEDYMSLLQVKAGDSVLETSVGTGLNFKFLPQGTKLSGLDLSAEMLANCQNNLRRWQMEADLYLGNAECLPFADGTFDAVYTCGGFNFFSDRAKALGEMIRVAKPGAHLMIEDETEEYVKSTYENIPFTSSFYSKRKQAVTVPIDLVPKEMEDIRVEMLKDGKFYAITFRKPVKA